MSKEGTTRKLTAILSADVEGYSIIIVARTKARFVINTIALSIHPINITN